ncbi:MAG: type VI secretion system contractile sheath large subunit [Polyangiales bacterium]
MSADDQAGVRVRWLVAGSLSPSPSGRRFTVSASSFGKALEDAGLRLGDLAVDSLKAFETKEVVQRLPSLKSLLALASELSASDPAKRPDGESTVRRVVEAAGEGELSAAVRAKFNIAPVAPPAAPAPASGEGALLDDLLAGGASKVAQPGASGAVSSFIKAMRPAGGATSTTAHRGARDLIEAYAYSAAAALLGGAEVSPMESAWRGLKLSADHAPDGGGLAVDVIDVAPAGAVDALRAALPEYADDSAPDLIVALDPSDDPEWLLSLAEVGADFDAPVVAAATHKLFGVDDPSAVPARCEQDDGGLPESWAKLRDDEASRWLAVAFNRPVVRVEGTGANRRTVFGSPSAALGAMLAASYQKSGAFARILGPSGGLKAPGSWELPSGREAGTLVPTEAFVPIRAQTRLGELGFVALGSGRNTDVIALTAAPAAKGGGDVAPLSAQVLTGRIVRFARWVVAQLPAGAAEEEVKLLFEQAAAVFLFPSAQEAAKLEAQVVADGDKRTVVIAVAARADLAGQPFNLAFGLPLPG